MFEKYIYQPFEGADVIWGYSHQDGFRSL